MTAGEQVKALPKKHVPQLNLSTEWRIMDASKTKLKVLWYSTSITTYAWFMFWIAFEIFVWHKPLLQTNPSNYVGALASIALIWAGTIIWKNRKPVIQTNAECTVEKLTVTKPSPPKRQRRTTPTASPATPECTHFFGYLNQREKTEEIPTECLTCQQVIQCFATQTHNTVSNHKSKTKPQIVKRMKKTSKLADNLRPSKASTTTTAQ
jgi:hypothetical protein